MIKFSFGELTNVLVIQNVMHVFSFMYIKYICMRTYYCDTKGFNVVEIQPRKYIKQNVIEV